ncbi:MAG: TIGR00725 family protein [Candidatus Aenigmatarchaeota archaeon]
MKKIVIGVIGPAREEYPEDGKAAERIEKAAEITGRLIARTGAVVLTGGMDGVMEAACRGAKSAGGLTIGTPGRERGMSNRYVDIEFLTPIGIGDFLFAGTWTCDALIVVPGSAGTMAELCLAYRVKKPVIILKGFDPLYDRLVNKYADQGRFVKILGAESPKEAVAKAGEMARQNLKKGREI